MSITLNKVGVEIDGKVYQFYKISFGFQRKLVEVQSNVNKLQNEIAKKYAVDVADIQTSDKVPDEDKLEIAKAGMELIDALSSLFVDKSEAGIIEQFDGDSLAQLIEALK